MNNVTPDRLVKNGRVLQYSLSQKIPQSNFNNIRQIVQTRQDQQIQYSGIFKQFQIRNSLYRSYHTKSESLQYLPQILRTDLQKEQLMTELPQVQAFRGITADNDISQKQVIKFLKWGNGDMEKALNYYYQRQQKSSKVNSKSLSKQEKSSNAFDKMKKASKKQMKRDEFIQNVKKIYELPVGQTNTGGVQTRRQRNQTSTVQNNQPDRKQPIDQEDQLDQLEDDMDKEQQVNNQFSDADYISHAFYKTQRRTYNQHKIQEQVRHQFIKQHKTVNSHQNSKLQRDKTSLQSIGLKCDLAIAQSKSKLISQKLPQDELQSQVNKTVEKDREIQQKIIKSEDYPYLQKLKELELYVGCYLLKCVATQARQMSQCPPGTPIEMQVFMEDSSKKGKNNFKKKEPNMNIRVAYKNGLILGRVDDKQARVLVPLITLQMIRVETVMFDRPIFMSFPKNFTLSVKIYLLKKAISDQPYVQTYQGDSDKTLKMYKEIRQQLLGLLLRLDLKIVTQPLIKGKSQYSKDSTHLKIGERSFSMSQGHKTQYQNQLNMINNREKFGDKIDKGQSGNHFELNRDHTNQYQKLQVGEQQNHVEKRVIQISNSQNESKFSQLIDLYQEDISPIYPSQQTFQSQLYSYQALALAWMMRRQGLNTNEPKRTIDRKDEDIHPLWTQYQLPTQSDQDGERITGQQQLTNNLKYRLFFNELTAQISLKRPISKIKCRGGILADEMGLGKTVMMSALIATDRDSKYNPLKTASMLSSGEKSPKPIHSKIGKNLIILPLTLLHQWQTQLKRHTKGLRVLQYYSMQRHRHANSLQNYDVVLTTYGTVSHEFSKGFHVTKSNLFRYKWRRIILDEAHYIKGRIIQTAKAAYQLQGDNRWCLTGTPIQNNLTDLFSLLHFIRYSPWADYQCWSRFIQKPYQNGEQTVLQVLRGLLKKVFLRRTKTSKDEHGNLIVALPERVSKVQILTMNPKQKQFYDSVYQASRKKIDELIDLNILQAKYMQVLQILMRLRQICCHPALFKSVTKFVKDPKDFETELRKFLKKREIDRERQAKNDSNNDEQEEDNVEPRQDELNYYEPIIEEDCSEVRIVQVDQHLNNHNTEQYFREITQKIVNNQLDACRICLNQMENPVITICLHIFCKACIIRQIQENRTCGYCRRQLSGKDDFLHLPRENRLNIDMNTILAHQQTSIRSEPSNGKTEFFRSTKMLVLMNHLKMMRSDEKAVVFSQFLGMLDLLEADLKFHKIGYARMQGCDSHKQRTKAITSFNDDPRVKVFIVSLRTAGVGLNLTAANKVFLIDPWWNPGVQEQAIERVHRIGQKKKVEIFRFIMDQTIQMRMLQLNTNKRNLSQAVLGKQKENSGSKGEGKSKADTLKYLLEKY